LETVPTGTARLCWENKLTISKKVLVVEDHADLRFILEKMLAFFGWDTVIAESGREALNNLEREFPSVILLDMWMPVMNGFELARILKEHTVYRNIPILAASAYTGRLARERCLAAGCDDFISKPFASSQLQKVLIDLCRQRYNITGPDLTAKPEEAESAPQSAQGSEISP
jgi:CheY-like chemotaxis protein